MKDSGVEWIGEIPREWSILRMKKCIIQRDGGAWGEDAKGNEGDCICLRIADFDYSRFIFKDTDNLTIRNYNQSTINKLKLRTNDILVEKSGGGEKTPVGRTVIFEKNYTALYANFMDRLRCADFINSKFMQYVFATFYSNDYTKNYIKQTTGIQNLDLTTMLSTELISLPPFATQHRIADYLDRKCSKIDEIIEKEGQVIEKLKAYKISVITEAVTKGLNPNVPMKDSGVKWIGEIPKRWKLNKFKYLSLSIGDGIHTTPQYDTDGTIYFVNGNNIGGEFLVFKDGTNTINDEEYSNYKLPLLTKNTVFITLNGATYGKTSFYNGEKILLGKSAGYITLKSNENKEYIRYYLQSNLAKLIMDLSLSGSTIANLSLRTLNDFIVPYPSHSEQEVIVNYLNKRIEKIDFSITKKQSVIDKLTAYKKSLIYEVVTGKKEV